MTCSQEYWSDRWQEEKTGWQLEDSHPKLREYLAVLTNGGKSKKFFIPLCGKTKDIPYLLSLGHHVFGIEYVVQAIEELDKENSLGLKFDEENSIHETPDGKLKIFCGDYMKCPIEKWGPFDIIWDRAAFIALDYPVRSEYAELLKRSVGINPGESHGGNPFKFILQSVEYDKNIFVGPPKCVTDEDIDTHFASWASVKLLERKYIPEDSPARTVTGKMEGDAYESYHLLQNKE